MRDKSESGTNDYHITVADFEAWEKENGPVPDRAVVLLRTGSSLLYANESAYYGFRSRHDYDLFLEAKERGEMRFQAMHHPGTQEFNVMQGFNELIDTLYYTTAKLQKNVGLCI